MLVVYIFALVVVVPLLFVFSILCFFCAPWVALVIMVAGGLSWYAHQPIPNDLQTGAVPYVDTRGYSGTIVGAGLVQHGAAKYVDYDKIRLPLTNNSAVTLYSVELICEADNIKYARTPSTLHAYWTGRFSPGTSIDALAYIPGVHDDPQYIDQRTLKCRIGDLKFDRPQAMLALGSDNVQTLVGTRYEVAIRDLDPGDNQSSARNQITISGAATNASTLPLYGVTFECYIDGKMVQQVSAKFDAVVPPHGRRAFQVSASPSSYGYDHRNRINAISCAVSSYDFGAS